MDESYLKFLNLIIDPAPPYLLKWIEELTVEQRQVLVSKALDQHINFITAQVNMLNMELDKLKTMKSMIKPMQK